MVKHEEENNDGDWAESRKLILYQLKTLTEAVQKLSLQVEELRIQTRLLYMRVSLIGGLAGVGGAAAVFVVEWLRRK